MGTEDTIAILATAASAGDNTAAAAFTDAVAEEGQAGFCGYHPELGEAKPVAHMGARLSHGGRHYFVDTPLSLSGRGIEFSHKFSGVPGSRKDGWNVYKVTLKAMQKLEAKYRIAAEMLL